MKKNGYNLEQAEMYRSAFQAIYKNTTPYSRSLQKVKEMARNAAQYCRPLSLQPDLDNAHLKLYQETYDETLLRKKAKIAISCEKFQKAPIINNNDITTYNMPGLPIVKGDVAALINLGNEYKNICNDVQAVDCFERAIKQNPNAKNELEYENIWRYLSQCYAEGRGVAQNILKSHDCLVNCLSIAFHSFKNDSSKIRHDSFQLGASSFLPSNSLTPNNNNTLLNNVNENNQEITVTDEQNCRRVIFGLKN